LGTVNTPVVLLKASPRFVRTKSNVLILMIGNFGPKLFESPIDGLLNLLDINIIENIKLGTGFDQLITI